MNDPNDNQIERADEIPLNSGETVFRGYGYSHFSYLPGQGFHATTNIPGFGQAEGLPNGLRHHDEVEP